MVRVTELERLLTRISGLSGPVKDITRVSIIANSSQSNEVLNRKRIHPYFHLVTHAWYGTPRPPYQRGHFGQVRQSVFGS